MDKVLEGVKVVELSTYVAASWAGEILTEMGADVIKVESLKGEPVRGFGPVIGCPLEEGEDPMFQLLNGGKKGVSIDLRSDEGRQVLFDLLEDADIFFTNNRMGALKKMGLTYEEVHERFPRLIYGHLSGYGLKGADAKLPGYDGPSFWARTGMLLDVAFEDSGPCSLVNGTGDMVTGLALVAGLVAALNKQRETGEGEYVLTSLFGCSIGVNALNILTTQDGYKEHFPKNRFHPTTPLTTSYVCRGDSGGITLSLLNYNVHWPIFCKNVIQRPDLLEDPRCIDEEAVKKPENDEFLTRTLIDIFKTQDQSYWAKLLADNDLPFSIAQHFKDVSHDQQAWDNGYLSEFTYENGHKGILPSGPVQFGENVAPEWKPAPKVGENTEELLTALGYTQDRIEELRENKTIR